MRRIQRALCALFALTLALLPSSSAAANPFSLPKDMPEWTIVTAPPRSGFSALVIARDALLYDAFGLGVSARLSPGDVVAVDACQNGSARVSFDGYTGYMRTEDLMALSVVPCITTRASVIGDCKWPRGDAHTAGACVYQVEKGTILYAAGLHAEGMIAINSHGTAVGYIDPGDIRALPSGVAA